MTCPSCGILQTSARPSGAGNVNCTGCGAVLTPPSGRPTPVDQDDPDRLVVADLVRIAVALAGLGLLNLVG